MPARITVVTPSFNQAQFLEETIQSVLAQREHIHEYFVVDGGSTDGSAELIKKYAGKGIDWWVSEKDKGQSDAIHRGFSKATGDILCWLNSDDVFMPRATEHVKRAFGTHDHWDVLTAYSLWIDGQSHLKRFNRIPGESNSWFRWGVQHVCQQTCFFKRKLYEQAGGLNLDLHCVMDTDLWFRFARSGAVWGHIPMYLAAFRHHAESKGATWLKKYENEHSFLAQTYPEFARASIRHVVGRAAYRASQLISGRYLQMHWETRRMRGKHWTELSP